MDFSMVVRSNAWIKSENFWRYDYHIHRKESEQKPSIYECGLCRVLRENL